MKEFMDRQIDIGPFVPGPDDDMIICRCEEVTKGEIRQAVHDGFFTMTEVKRFLRIGMGLCQGQTCGRLVKNIIQEELGKRISAEAENTSRAPMRPVPMEVYGKERD